MNKNMIGGILRHAITVIAGAVIVNGSNTLESSISGLMKNITAGDTNAIIAASVVIFSILWSMWTKATEQTKETVVKVLTFKKTKE